MIKVIHSATQPVISDVYIGQDARYIVVQMNIEGETDQTAVKAVGKLEGSIDGKDWTRIATLTAEGHGRSFDGGPLETFWPALRFNLIEVRGGVVDAFLAKGR